MKNYEVHITREISGYFEIKANSPSEAEDKVYEVIGDANEDLIETHFQEEFTRTLEIN